MSNAARNSSRTSSPFLSRYGAFATSGVEGSVLREQ